MGGGFRGGGGGGCGLLLGGRGLGGLARRLPLLLGLGTRPLLGHLGLPLGLLPQPPRLLVPLVRALPRSLRPPPLLVLLLPPPALRHPPVLLLDLLPLCVLLRLGLHLPLPRGVNVLAEVALLLGLLVVIPQVLDRVPQQGACNDGDARHQLGGEAADVRPPVPGDRLVRELDRAWQCVPVTVIVRVEALDEGRERQGVGGVPLIGQDRLGPRLEGDDP
mmetsp:Transcript_27004/g.68077  ORF Transcript_27004/g.68077 Transcript_27004/m.68077 type:complete len:219 (-) Transcript_27004:1513-2169(-)